MKTDHPNDYYNFTGTAEMGARVREWKDRARYRLDAKDGPAYRLGKFLQATVLSDPEAARFCRESKISMAKAQSENIDTAGGWVVPDELVPIIVAIREAYGTVRRSAKLWPLRMGGNASVPRRVNSAKAVWTSEGATLNEDTSTSYDSATLGLKKLSVLLKASAELEEDAVAAWALDIAENIGMAFAQAEDDACFIGDGSLTYGRVAGLQTKLADGAHGAGKITATGHSTYAAIDQTDVSSLLAALPARAIPGAKIFVSPAGYGLTLVRLSSTTGGLAATLGPNGELHANYFGYPVELSPSLPAGTGSLTGKLVMAIGDMRLGVALGERRQITVKRLAERFVDTDQIAFVATERVDVNVHDVGDNSTAGALVGLFAG